MWSELASTDLRKIRAVVPELDLRAIVALQKAGFDLVRLTANRTPEQAPPLRAVLARGVSSHRRLTGGASVI